MRPESTLHRRLNPDWQWGLPEQLAAAAVDALHLLFWAKTKDGQKGRNRPRQIPRPGVKGPERIGDNPVSTDEMDEFLGWEVRSGG